MPALVTAPRKRGFDLELDLKIILGKQNAECGSAFNENSIRDVFLFSHLIRTEPFSEI
jgi:hypothetical protein